MGKVSAAHPRVVSRHWGFELDVENALGCSENRTERSNVKNENSEKNVPKGLKNALSGRLSAWVP